MGVGIQSFNPKNVDFTKEFMFFGEQPNVSRYDVQRHRIFEELNARQLGYFWQPEEVRVVDDIGDFKKLDDVQKHIFIETLKYQTLLDSTQARSVNLILLPFVSIPELETLIETWAFFETIHSRSYTYILRNIVPDPSVIFDDIMVNEMVMKRAEGVSRLYDDFIQYGMVYKVHGYGKHRVGGRTVNVSEMELKTKALNAMVAINILEGLRFYGSFACSFAFAENGLMEGNAKLIEFIARDENLHLAISQNILRKWARGEDDPVMVEIFKDNIPFTEELYSIALNEEKEWNEYLFSKGSMMGMNLDILNSFLDHIEGMRKRAIGIKSSAPRENPLKWVDKYLTSSDSQAAPQETEKTSYVVAGINNDIVDPSETFSDINL